MADDERRSSAEERRKKGTQVLVFSWHEATNAYNGGLARTKGILSRVRALSYTLVDRDRPLVCSSASVDLAPYRIPRFVDTLTEQSYLAGRFVDWALSTCAMIGTGLAASRRRRYDLVFVPASELPHMALAGFLVGKLIGAKIVFCNLNTRAVPGWALNRVLHRHVDHIITLSRALAAEIRGEGIEVPLSINGVGVEGAPIREEREDLVVYVARHTPAKGVWDVLAIWERVHARMPNAALAMAGVVTPAMRHELDQRIAARGLRSSVRILGPIEENEKWGLYGRARCCLFPSRVEGWGIVPIEAMMSGVPVVAYDLPAYADTISGLDGVALLAVGDVEGAADAVIHNLRLDGSERRRLEDKLHRQSKGFEWDAVVDREEAILADVARS